MSEAETTLVERFTHDHRECDRMWAEVEDARDDAALARAWARFELATREHLRVEEEILFVALDRRAPPGPTSVMRMEHAQMRGLLSRIAEHVAARRRDAVLDDGDTLLILVRQHNAKEEAMLYPTAERVLADAWPSLRAMIPPSFGSVP